MFSQDIFCNTPWFELHVYWDGGLGACCQESHRLYDLAHQEKYHVSNMTISEWHNSQVMCKARQQVLGDKPISFCSQCEHEERFEGHSRRIRSNLKSVIFHKSDFKSSLAQSPHLKYFNYSRDNSGQAQSQIQDVHIDLGNYCNLTCKHCSSQASSAIASQNLRWGKKDAAKYIGTDWTKNESVFQRFLSELVQLPLKNLHFMGGETLITKKFEDTIDYFIKKNKTDLSISFVSNGTVFPNDLIKKLANFSRVGIEISLETLTQHNAYQRQGTDTQQVLQNISLYQALKKPFDLTLRPAVSALTIGHYNTLLEYALEKKLMIKSRMVSNPEFLQIAVLPQEIRSKYLEKFQTLEKKILAHSDNNLKDYNISDVKNIARTVLDEIHQVSKQLSQPELETASKLRLKLVNHLARWDSVSLQNALDLYPEFSLISEFKHYAELRTGYLAQA